MQFIVRQPNGRYAIFDKRFVDLSTNMDVGDVKECFRDIRDRSYSAIEAEMKAAKAEKPFDFGLIDIANRSEQRPQGTRWNEVIALVRAVHGEEEISQYLDEAGCPDFAVGVVSDEFASQMACRNVRQHAIRGCGPRGSCTVGKAVLLSLRPRHLSFPVRTGDGDHAHEPAGIRKHSRGNQDHHRQAGGDGRGPSSRP